MSNQQQKDNSGALFPNKSDNPKAPIKKGPLMVNGVMWEMAVWNQTSKDGKTYESVKVSPPYKKEASVDEAF
jgi:hypothetical protein